jgi:hypothetical protein
MSISARVCMDRPGNVAAVRLRIAGGRGTSPTKVLGLEVQPTEYVTRPQTTPPPNPRNRVLC